MTTSGNGTQSRIRDSVTVQMCAILLSVYLMFGILEGDLFNIVSASPSFLSGCISSQGISAYFVQNNCLVMKGWIWMLVTSLFLHLNPIHIGGNLLFLLIFGTSLEERISRRRWVLVYLTSGISGNLAFLVLGPLLGSEVGLGASGAIYGLLGAAGGPKGAFLMIILLGLNLFAGGGEVAHVAGLLTGLVWYGWGDYFAGIWKGENAL